MATMEIRITGRVQGVGFRYFTLKAAQEWRIKGWVKNLPDGSVLLRAVGDDSAMAQFRLRLRQGPRFGRVDLLEETLLSPDESCFPDFKVIH